MDTHELTNKMMECQKIMAAHTEEIKTLFQQQKQITSLAESTNRLALSVEKLAGQMEGHEERLSEIEEGVRYKSRTVWASVVTGILGAVVAFIVASLLP